MVAEKTTLYNRHLENNGNMVSFAGYLLPTHYTGIKSEHFAVRNNAGLFDVSHMGEITISGKDSFDFLQYITTNTLEGLSIGQAQYTILCNEKGGIIDDLILYKKKNSFMIVVNAANRSRDLKWLKSQARGDVSINDISDQLGLLALQGPKSRHVLKSLINIGIDSLPFYHFIECEILGYNVLVSRTGYTGELGYELFVDNKNIIDLWDNLLTNGADYGIRPAGLGCRDTLRMEMKYCLHGNDINIETNPIEAGLGWVTNLEKGPFIGRGVCLESKKGLKQRLICFEMVDRAIPRNGCLIIRNDSTIGNVTSGTMSPSLNKGIGIAYIQKKYAKIGSEIIVNIRGKMKKAIVVKPPFYKKGSLMT